ncbi:Bax inhibitor-1/YccA family protein [Sediminicola luteus]|uniref:Permease n=1 Tax=Sediminicola luteus TaxID=319238 RepID=A0A2A4G6M8_9FLAO|nr:Bax inhibitor-1 family protein [Sediminicola luteus]PCE64091.1 permease [Sediminicola luteus]
MQDLMNLEGATTEEKALFYRKTYGHVAGGVLVFILVEYLFLQSQTIVNFALSLLDGYLWLITLGGFMLVTHYAESVVAKSHDRNVQYLGYLLYIIAEAFIFVPLIYIAIAYANGPVLQQAAILTLSLFTGLSAVVLLTKKDFSFLRSIITIASFIALGLIVAGILFGFELGLWFSVGMVALAAGAILYQTSNLVHKYQSDQYVVAALGLFSALMLLFWYILRIFLSRD